MGVFKLPNFFAAMLYIFFHILKRQGYLV